MGMSKSEAGKLGYLKSKYYWDEVWRKLKEDYYKSPKICVECKTNIPYEKRINKFCSSVCSATHNNKKRLVKSRLCDMCGILYSRKYSGKYCSKKCYLDYNWRNTKGRFEKGLITDRQALRRIMIRIHGEKCFNCGLTEWMGKQIPVEVHHEDGNSNNNLPNNIKLLCYNCHGQTPTYRAKNKGKGRHFRRERYKKGLSY